MNPPSTALVDFGDAIGPMVVKELRQGLRTRVFTWAFLFIQGMLLLFMTAGFAESNDGRDTAAPFWILLELALLVVMPARGLGALNTEIRLNTMELISLTRMSAWRITFGKWVALMSQSVLLATAVMPYIVLRYFFGGMNVLAELFLLFVVIGLSGLLTALMVGLSVVSNFLIRCFFTVPVMISVITFMGASVALVTRGDGISLFRLSGWAWVAFVPGAIFLGYYLLDMAASRIAPQAVNYVTRRRVIGLVAFLVTVVLAHSVAIAGYLFYPFFFFTLLALDALTENPATVASVYVPFQRSPLTRLLEYFLAPGWFSGTFYVLLMAGILIVAGVVFPDVWDVSSLDTVQEGIALVLGFTASALLPLAAMLLFRPSHHQPIVSYCLITILMGVLSSTLMPMVESGNFPAVVWFGGILPPVATYAALSNSASTEETVALMGPMVAIILLSLWVVCRKAAKLKREMERAEREDLSA